ncbi:hypothetical protein [Streptomyces sp. NPDC058280]|uniref:hypothetical protein n=1 Tax=Streptomyces sp. NPDC058280 TaxID=3346419 RepID=UPI0036E3CE8E
MGGWISVVVILGMIAVGVLLIHLVNGQHRRRMATYTFGKTLWDPRNRVVRRSDRGDPHDHRSWGRGHFRQHLRIRGRGRGHGGTGTGTGTDTGTRTAAEAGTGTGAGQGERP